MSRAGRSTAPDRRRLEADTQAYLAKGGQVDRVATGRTNRAAMEQKNGFLFATTRPR